MVTCSSLGFPPFPPPAAASGWQEEEEELEEDDQGRELLVELGEEAFPPPLMVKLLPPQLPFWLSPVLEREVISVLFGSVAGGVGGVQRGEQRWSEESREERKEEVLPFNQTSPSSSSPCSNTNYHLIK